MPRRSLSLALAAPLLAAACGPSLPPGGGPAAGAAPRVCAILSVNDTYRIEPSPDGTGGLARVRALRRRLEAEHPDLLVLHAGDFLFPSLLSRGYQGAQMIDVLNRLDGSDAFDPRLVITFGNHELEDDRASIMASRLDESAFRWVSSNIEFEKTEDGTPVLGTHKIAEDVLLSCGGVNVGVFGLTTDVKSAPYVRRFKSPIDTAKIRTRSLRDRGAEVVVGLTHLDVDMDARLLETLGAEGPDLIVGGHEHAKQTRSVGGRSVFKADSDARTANLIEVTVGPSGIGVEHRWVELGPDEPVPDPELQSVVIGWLEKHDRWYCQEKVRAKVGCLSEQLTVAKADLIADEYPIRRFETNLGNYVADQMLVPFAQEGAQIAFINAGSLRLNYNMRKGSPITRRAVEELFAYPAPLRLIEISGATLQKIVDRAVSGWTGQGHWLQIAGFAFRHDPAAGTATDLTLLGPVPKRVAPTDKIRAVTTAFLLDPMKGQDGYTMLRPEDIVDRLGLDLTVGPDLKQLVMETLRQAGPAGIAPAVDGRICNVAQPGPCLIP